MACYFARHTFEWIRIQQLLDTYEKVSRQKLNKDKTSIFFSKNTRHAMKEKFLSQARNEVLLKAVVQTIPTYIMSVFQLPKKLCSEINSMMSKFWWGHKGNDAWISWMSWEKFGRTKAKKGLGYRDWENFRGNFPPPPPPPPRELLPFLKCPPKLQKLSI
jgi:hypothetical protein